MSVLILAMIQDQALVASKHYLVETEGKSSVDPPCTPVDKNVATAIYKKKSSRRHHFVPGVVHNNNIYLALGDTHMTQDLAASGRAW